MSNKIQKKGDLKMKVLAFNNSPNAENGNTALILNPFLKATEKAKAELV